MAAETEIQFDGWTVNRISGEMTRGGRALRLTQQPLRILVELYDHAGEIVTRERLVKVLWPQGVVDFDNGLNVAVRKLRVALDDVGDTPKYIETLPRVGYRFLVRPGAAAEALPYEAATAVSRRARMLAGISLAVLIAALAVWTWRTATAEKSAAPVSAEVATKPKHQPSVRARELYLEGLGNRSRDVSSSRIAVEKFEAALREDPEYAEAWAALAESYSGAVIQHTMPRPEAYPAALAAAKRAIELDETLPQGHIALAQILLDHERDFAASRVELDRARALNEQSARLWHFYAMWHAHQGQIEQALEAIRRSRELEPTFTGYQANYAMILYNARRYEEVVAFLTTFVEANPGSVQARSILADALIATGDLAGAQRQLALRPSPNLFQAEAGYLAAKQGRREAAMSEIERLEEMGSKGFGTAYPIAIIHTTLGDLDRGCEYLARAVDDHSILLAWMRLDPRLDPLRGRRCFAEVEKQVYAKVGQDRGDN